MALVIGMFPCILFTHVYNTDVLLAIGNSAKAGVRFVSYDHFKHALADTEVSIRITARPFAFSPTCASTPRQRLTYFRG